EAEGALGLYDLSARTAAGDDLMSGTARVTNALPR
ncbi:MAG: hypothetical protein JWQ03_801, partial [Variovorax sp.]|nr:hypothetical protein [Variovorax sp.]